MSAKKQIERKQQKRILSNGELAKNKNTINNSNQTNIKDIKDEKTIMKMLFECKSRGKKQRLKERLMEIKSLDKQSLEEFLKTKREESKANQDNMLIIKEKLNNNTQSKGKRRNKGESNSELMLEEYKEEVIENERTNINKQTKKLRREERKENKLLAKKRDKISIQEKEEEEEMNGGMHQYFNTIEEKLKSYK